MGETYFEMHIYQDYIWTCPSSGIWYCAVCLPNINCIPKESNLHSQCHEKLKSHQIIQSHILYPGCTDERYVSIMLQTTGTVCNCCVWMLVGWIALVSIVTHYGWDGLRIKSLWRRDFPHPSRPAWGLHGILHNTYLCISFRG